MLKVYVNYPNQRISVHRNPLCEEIQKMSKPNQRLVRIDVKTISAELQRFTARHYVFAAERDRNDMWVELDFGDAQFESAVLAYVHRLIGKRYSGLASAPIDKHC